MEEIAVNEVTDMAKEEGRVIRISADVEKRLATRGKFGQSFSDVIKDLLDEVENKKN